VLYLFENCMFRLICSAAYNHLVLTSLALCLMKEALSWLSGWSSRLNCIIRVVLGWSLTGQGWGRIQCGVISLGTRELSSSLRIFAKLYKFEEKHSFLLRKSLNFALAWTVLVCLDVNHLQ